MRLCLPIATVTAALLVGCVLSAQAEIAGTLGTFHGPTYSRTTPHASDKVNTKGITVRGASDVKGNCLLTLYVPVSAGDTVRLSAWGRVTNDTGVVVGLGTQLWGRDADDATVPLFPLSPATGSNITPQIHHLPVAVPTAMWPVPATWPAGHRLVAMLYTNAHSKEYARASGPITVDPLGVITAERYSSN